jgi:outer membrane biosynthesis protein TonB
MRCEDVQPRLSDVLDARLSPANLQEVEAHLQTCERCQATLRKLRAVSRLAFAQKELFPNEATEAYFGDFASRLEKRLGTEFPELTGAAPFPEGDLFATDMDSFAKLDASEATGLSIPTAFVAARKESSVLFNLTALQRALNDARPKTNPTPKEPGSGLIDRRSLQKLWQQIGSNSSEQNAAARTDSFSQPGFTPVIGASFGTSPKTKKTSRLLIAGVIGISLLVVGLVVFALSGLFSAKPGETPINQQVANVATPNNTVAVAPTTPPPADPAVTTPTPTVTPTATPTADPKTPKVDPKKDPKLTDPKANTTTPKETTKTETPAVKQPDPLATVTPKEDPTKTSANNGKNKDELDDLLGGKKDTGTATASGPETLSNAQISGVMAKANTSSCLAIGTGKVQMKVTISSSGSVTNAAGDGTALGNCVAGIVRRLKFPSISSPSQTFPYPVYVK